MASTGKGKRRVKGKTVGLNSFLATDQDAPSGFAVINTNYNWGDVMEDTPVDDKFTLDYKDPKKDKIYLPTAPKAARGPDIDMNRVPTKPPFTAYVGNLPYDVMEDDIIKFFRQLKVTSVRLPREGGGERGRLRGFGYAEFADKQSLLDALSLNNESLKSRSIRVNLAGDHENERDHDRRDDRSDRTAGDWRAGGRDEAFSRDTRDDRQRNGAWYDRSDRGGGRSNRREGDSREDFEWRRGGDRDGYKREDRFDRRDRGGGYERRDYGNRERDAGPKERPKLQLKPRSVPLEQQDANPVGSASIFGGAKPVDTAAKEREIEERLSKEKVIPEQRPRSYSEDDQHSNSSSTSAGTRGVENTKDSGPDIKETKENIKHTGASTAAVFGGAKPVDTAARERQIEERLEREREQESKKLSDPDRHSSARPPPSSRTGRYEGRSRQDEDLGPRAGSRGRTTYNREHGNNSRENSYERRDPHGYHYGREDDGERNRHNTSGHSETGDSGSTKPLEHDVQNAQEYAVPQYQEDKPPVYASTNKFLHLMPDDDDNGSTSE